MKRLLLLVLTISVLSASAQSWQNIQKELQTQFIMAEDGDTISLEAGNFRALGTISMDDKKNIVIRGAGMDKTTLSFKGQSEGAEGIRITHSQNITMMDMTIQDAKGDCIKVMDTEGIFFRRVKVEWPGKPKSSNGAYGFYPVSCSNVLLDECIAIGASDAGIYVGQSHNIMVRKCIAYNNVAGIEIENSTMADVFDCEAYNNTGGILVFDLPDLPKNQGGNVRVYENNVYENNYKNFAPKGNMVATIPPGTGVLILSTSNVEVFSNKITNNRTTGVGIISYYTTEIKFTDEDFNPYPSSIYVHDNTFERKKQRPTWRHKIGFLLWSKFKKNVPAIQYDGILNPEHVDENGELKPEYSVCIRNNKGGDFVNLDLGNGRENISTDVTKHDCYLRSLSAPDISTASN